MCAAITYVDKQRFPFSDVQRGCFSEIANHAKINGAKDVPLIAGNIFCKAVQMHSVFTSAWSYAGVRCAFIKGRHNPWQNQKKYTSSRTFLTNTNNNFKLCTRCPHVSRRFVFFVTPNGHHITHGPWQNAFGGASTAHIMLVPRTTY